MPANVKREQRRFPRYTINGCAVQARESYLFGLFSKLTKKQMVINISLEGVRFISRESFGQNTQLVLNITAPYLRDIAIELKSLVTWERKVQGLSAYSVGARFVGTDRTNRDKLKALIERATKSKNDISSYINLKATQK